MLDDTTSYEIVECAVDCLVKHLDVWTSMECLDQLSSELADFAPNLPLPCASLLSDTLHAMGYELELSRSMSTSVDVQRQQSKQDVLAFAQSSSQPCQSLATAIQFTKGTASVDVGQAWLFFVRLGLDPVRALGVRELGECCRLLAYAATYSTASLDEVVAAWLDTYMFQHTRQSPGEKALRNLLVQLLLHRCISLFTVLTRYFTPLTAQGGSFAVVDRLSQLQTLRDLLVAAPAPTKTFVADESISRWADSFALAARRMVLCAEADSASSLVQLAGQVVTCYSTWSIEMSPSHEDVRREIFSSEVLLRSFRSSSSTWLVTFLKPSATQEQSLLALQCLMDLFPASRTGTHELCRTSCAQTC